ncbi:FeoB-associated Cys-rich membrane protein [Sedimentibacter hydroxybenzoicus]|uniref:FeoB-associated Cys-rich membrane protein n=1 Tax=Sedimentibacter hydroxybenzoicus TaxID=29345 RepID=UPI001C52BBA9|nr:FeoB-associated Cys-rich membrane protein [Sedimentibacter hydroxybenzoicus]
MNFSDIIVISIIVVIIAGVVVFMKKQKKNGSGCHSGCSGCSKSEGCSTINK